MTSQRNQKAQVVQSLFTVAVASVALSLAACGGGDGASAPASSTPTPVANIVGPGTTEGKLSVLSAVSDVKLALSMPSALAIAAGVDDADHFVAAKDVCSTGTASLLFDGSVPTLGVVLPKDEHTIAASFQNCTLKNSGGVVNIDGASAVHYNVNTDTTGVIDSQFTRLHFNFGSASKINLTVNGAVKREVVTAVSGTNITGKDTYTPGRDFSFTSHRTGLTASIQSGTVLLTVVANNGGASSSGAESCNDLAFTIEQVAYHCSGTITQGYNANGVVTSATGEWTLDVGGVVVGRIFADTTGYKLEADGVVRALAPPPAAALPGRLRSSTLSL